MATKDEQTKDTSGQTTKPKATVVKDDMSGDTIIDPQTGQRISSTNEPDETGSTSGIPPVGPTDMNGDGEPDAGVEEQDELRQRYQDEVDARTEDAQRRGSQSPSQGPEQKRRANTLAEALYPNENVSDEAKEAVAPKADAAHA
jgi:hypothetical protein